MMKPFLKSVKNAVSVYVDTTVREPIKDIKSAQQPRIQRPRSSATMAFINSMNEQKKHLSPKCEVVAPVSNLRAHYLGNMDTAARYRRTRNMH